MATNNDTLYTRTARAYDGLERKLDRIAGQPEVTLERDVDAMVCGRTGCRESTNLVRLAIPDLGGNP